MTYREKLQKEHPECIGTEFKGGCKMCPFCYGYEPDKSQCPCTEVGYNLLVNPGSGCTRCWDRVIPGTEDKKYENCTRDELIALIKHLEGRIETKDKVIANYTAACEDKNTRIMDLKKECEERKRAMERAGERIKERDNAIVELQNRNESKNKKIEELEGACSAYSAENTRLVHELGERNEALEYSSNRINGLHEKCDLLKKALTEARREAAVYRSQSTQTYGTCCCKADVIAEKDREIQRLNELLADKKAEIAKLGDGFVCLRDAKNKEIESLKKSLTFEQNNKDYWYDERHRLVKKINELENSNQELKDALEEEKKEHAKHHSLFGKYFAD